MRLIQNEEGSIYGEAVVVLPAFILVWTLVSFVFTGYEQASQMGMDVRREAWLHSQGSNDWSGANAYHESVCTNAPGSGVSSSASLGIVSTLGAVVTVVGYIAEVVTYQPGVIWPGDALSTSVAGVTLSVPGGSWLEYTSMIKRNWHYTKTGTVSRPIIGGSANVGHHTYLVCDENEEEMTNIEATIWLATSWFIIKLRAGV